MKEELLISDIMFLVSLDLAIFLSSTGKFLCKDPTRDLNVS